VGEPHDVYEGHDVHEELKHQTTALASLDRPRRFLRFLAPCINSGLTGKYWIE
jgi:hypothetical protein